MGYQCGVRIPASACTDRAGKESRVACVVRLPPCPFMTSDRDSNRALTMTDQEAKVLEAQLSKEIAEASDKLNELIERREKREKDLRDARFQRLQGLLRADGVLDILAPEHQKPRYDEVCSDTNPVGQKRVRDNHKEYGCLRCALIEARDGLIVSCDFTFEFSL